MHRVRHPIVEEDLAVITAAPLPWEDFAGATVLVTGAGGFLPAYMVETLLYLNETRLRRKARVVALVRNLDRARERFAGYLDRSELEFVVQDVSDPLTASGPFDYVVHAASQASPVHYRTDPAGTLSANVLGTHHLLTAAQKHPVRAFLFFSSGEVYGTVSSNARPMAEDQGGFLDPADVRSCYGESKRMGETMCAAWAQQFGVPTRMVRPFHTYGPGMRLDDGRVFADFVRDILKGGPIVMHSDGRARRSFCYLADATLGFFTVLFNGANGGAYNIANPGGECSIAELAGRLAVEFQSEGTTVERRGRSDANYFPSSIVSTRANIDKARALGWNPTHSVEQGFRRTVESYR